jgi:hypothetical protein
MIELQQAIFSMRCAFLARIAKQKRIHNDRHAIEQLASRMDDAAVLTELYRMHQRFSWWKLWLSTRR